MLNILREEGRQPAVEAVNLRLQEYFGIDSFTSIEPLVVIQKAEHGYVVSPTKRLSDGSITIYDIFGDGSEQVKQADLIIKRGKRNYRQWLFLERSEGVDKDGWTLPTDDQLKVVELGVFGILGLAGPIWPFANQENVRIYQGKLVDRYSGKSGLFYLLDCDKDNDGGDLKKFKAAKLLLLAVESGWARVMKTGK